jgi:hypothetical protein
MAIRKLLDISISHITPQDAALLASVGAQVAATEYEYGFYVRVTSSDEGYLMDRMTNARRLGFSVPFVHLLRTAAQNDCELIMLDRDGLEDESLPAFRQRWN